MTSTLGHYTLPDLIAQARGFANAQRHVAARSTEDRTHWHHVALADLLDELAERLAKTEPTP